MYFLNDDGLAQWWTPDWPVSRPWTIWPGGGGRSLTEDELIDDELKRGTTVNDVTNKIFSNRHPELRDCRLPRSCQELERLQREWALIRGKVAAKKGQGGRKNVPKP